MRAKYILLKRRALDTKMRGVVFFIIAFALSLVSCDSNKPPSGQITNPVPIQKQVPNENKQAYQNEPDGFRDLKWGDDIASNQDFKEVKVTGQVNESYEKKNEKLSFGDAKVRKILYMTIDGKLESVILLGIVDEKLKTIADGLTYKFGEPTKTSKIQGDAATQFRWEGNVTNISLIVMNVGAYWVSFNDAQYEKAHDRLIQDQEEVKKKKVANDF